LAENVNFNRFGFDLMGSGVLRTKASNLDTFSKRIIILLHAVH